MSVLIGIIAENTVILAADRRMIDVNTRNVTSEEHDKIFILNSKVAISVLGSAWLAMKLKSIIEAGTANQADGVAEILRAEDACEITDLCFKTIKEDPQYSNEMGCVLIVAGEDNYGNATIRWKADDWSDWSTGRGEATKLIPVIIQPPEMSYTECESILKAALDRCKRADGNLVFALKDAIGAIALKAVSINSQVTVWMGNTKRLIYLE